MSRVTRSGGRMLAVIAAATTAGLLFGAVPAYASNTSKEGDKPRWQDSTQFTFTSTQLKGGRRDKVHGNVTLVIHKDGNWEMDSHTKNNLIAWRNVTFNCTIKYDAPHREIEFEIPRHRVDGKESRDRHREAYEPEIQADWSDIAEYGQTDCSMDVG